MYFIPLKVTQRNFSFFALYSEHSAQTTISHGIYTYKTADLPTAVHLGMDADDREEKKKKNKKKLTVKPNLITITTFFFHDNSNEGILCLSCKTSPIKS